MELLTPALPKSVCFCVATTNLYIYIVSSQYLNIKANTNHNFLDRCKCKNIRRSSTKHAAFNVLMT